MAKESGSKGSGMGSNTPSMRQNVKRADIFTAGKASMGPENYEQGYPANENEMLNMNFSGRKPKGS